MAVSMIASICDRDNFLHDVLGKFWPCSYLTHTWFHLSLWLFVQYHFACVEDLVPISAGLQLLTLYFLNQLFHCSKCVPKTNQNHLKPISGQSYKLTSKIPCICTNEKGCLFIKNEHWKMFNFTNILSF